MVFDEEIIRLEDHPSYPEPKNVWGSKFWGVFHNIAANYPDKPTRTQKAKMKDLIANLIDNIPCEECKIHAKKYIKTHKINVKNKRELSKFLCNFHNDVNERLGKPIVECNTILEGGEDCNECKITLADTPAKIENIDFKPLDDAYLQIIKEICNKYGVPMPQVIFNEPCPVNSNNSCIEMKKDGSDAKIYINRHAATWETIGNELGHYIKARKGDLSGALDEATISREAYQAVEEYKKKQAGIVSNINIMEDKVPVNKKVILQDTPFGEDEDDFGDIFGGSSESDLSSSIEKAEKPDKGGVFDFLDSYYKPIADLTGISAKDLNDANTPEIIGYTTDALQDMFLSPLGTVAVNVLSGIAMYSVPILMSDLPSRDKKLLAEIGSHKFWSLIRYANPQVNKIAYAQAAQAGAALQRMDINGIMSAFLSTPGNSAPAKVSPTAAAIPKAMGVNSPPVINKLKSSYFVNGV
jgi:hypothetical protein